MDLNTGVRQENGLLPILLNTALEEALKKLMQEDDECKRRGQNPCKDKSAMLCR